MRVCAFFFFLFPRIFSVLCGVVVDCPSSELLLLLLQWPETFFAPSNGPETFLRRRRRRTDHASSLL